MVPLLRMHPFESVLQIFFIQKLSISHGSETREEKSTLHLAMWRERGVCGRTYEDLWAIKHTIAVGISLSTTRLERECARGRGLAPVSDTAHLHN